MGLLNYFKKLKDKVIVAPIPEDDLKARLKHFQLLVDNCEEVKQTIGTNGWKVIERVIVDSIENWKHQLTYETNSEEVRRLQVSIQNFSDWLSIIDDMDETIKKAREEITSEPKE